MEMNVKFSVCSYGDWGFNSVLYFDILNRYFSFVSGWNDALCYLNFEVLGNCLSVSNGRSVFHLTVEFGGPFIT